MKLDPDASFLSGGSTARSFPLHPFTRLTRARDDDSDGLTPARRYDGDCRPASSLHLPQRTPSFSLRRAFFGGEDETQTSDLPPASPLLPTVSPLLLPPVSRCRLAARPCPPPRPLTAPLPIRRPRLSRDRATALGRRGVEPLPSAVVPPPRGRETLRMDKVTQAVENLKEEWNQAVAQLEGCIAAIESCGKMGKGTEEASSLPRLNGSAQDALQLLNSLQCRLDPLAEQLPTFEEVQSGQATLQSWKEQYQKLRMRLRNANLQANANIKKAAQEERELLLGGGEESTIRRRSGKKCKYLGNICKAEGEYQGHRSLLMRTRGLLSTMQRQDVLDRIILTIGFLIFSLAVLYVVSRRIGLLTLQRKLADAIRSGSISAEDVVAKVKNVPVPAPAAPAPAPPIYDEL
uniref:Sec20 C-terminal domain-containing protein n=1 Tax=Oryza meridionalis TaxID=40149 RepID=A0A0E0CPC2_9ORYZ